MFVRDDAKHRGVGAIAAMDEVSPRRREAQALAGRLLVTLDGMRARSTISSRQPRLPVSTIGTQVGPVLPPRPEVPTLPPRGKPVYPTLSAGPRSAVMGTRQALVPPRGMTPSPGDARPLFVPPPGLIVAEPKPAPLVPQEGRPASAPAPVAAAPRKPDAASVPRGGGGSIWQPAGKPKEALPEIDASPIDLGPDAEPSASARPSNRGKIAIYAAVAFGAWLLLK